MTLYEPATLVTDCLLAALAACLAWRLYATMPRSNLAVRWWSRALALTAVSAIVGGTYHGFAANLPGAILKVWWILVLLVIATMSAAMDLSLVHEFISTGRQGHWRQLIALKLCVFSVGIVAHPVFVVAVLDYGMTMLTWCALALASRRLWRVPMLVAVGVSLVATLVQQLRWSPSVHLNHNDIYHLIQGLDVVMVRMYRRRPTARGVQNDGDRNSPKQNREASARSTPVNMVIQAATGWSNDAFEKNAEFQCECRQCRRRPRSR